MTLPEFVTKHNIPVTWLAEVTGFNRTQVSNWVKNIHPIPSDKLPVMEKAIHNIGEVFQKVKLEQ